MTSQFVLFEGLVSQTDGCFIVSITARFSSYSFALDFGYSGVKYV